MNKKLRSQVSNCIKHTSEELPAEFIELSEEDLQQIVGGKSFWDRKFWSAVRGEVQDTLYKPGTGEDLFIPIEWRVLGRLFGSK
jgi:bacteriocin-like protein